MSRSSQDPRKARSRAHLGTPLQVYLSDEDRERLERLAQTEIRSLADQVRHLIRAADREGVSDAARR